MIKTICNSCIKIFGILCFFCIIFFTVYAFRYTVLDTLVENKKITFAISNQEVKNLTETLRSVEANNEHLDDIKNTFLRYLPEFTYHAVIKDEQDFFMYFSDGFAPTKKSSEYLQSIQIPFKDKVVTFNLYPKFTTYLWWVRIIVTIIAAFVTLGLLKIIRLLRKNIKISQLLDKMEHFHKFGFLRKLSSKFILLNLMVGGLAFVSFLFMYENRGVVFEYMAEFHVSSDGPSTYVKRLREAIVNEPIENYSAKKLSKLLMDANQENYESYVYDELGKDYIANNFHKPYPRSFIKNSFYDINIVTTPYFYSYPIKTKNQTVQLLIYDYPLVSYVDFYQFIILFVSLSFYLYMLFLFVNKKVKELLVLQKDIQLLGAGEWNHAIITRGNDEISNVSCHLEKLRVSYIDAKDKEQELKKANKSLVEAISHDLRTPLTTLKSYLEIIQLHKGDPLRYEEYLTNCLGKIEEIKVLSDKMFAYSFVYDSEDETIIEGISLLKINEVLQKDFDFLELKGFYLDVQIVKESICLKGNIYLIKRVLNNIVSNIVKYAEPSFPIRCRCTHKERHFLLEYSNSKRVAVEHIESTNIGIKSIEKMMKAMDGSVKVVDDEQFKIEVCFVISME